MSIEQNKTLVRRYVEEVWNEQNYNIIDELFDDNYTIHQGAQSMRTSHEALRQGIMTIRTAFPDFHMTIDNLIGAGDMVAAHWVNHGTQQGEFRFPDSPQSLPPSGREVTFTEAAVFRVVGDKIAEVWYVSDRLSMMQQLGVIPPVGRA